MNKVSWADYRRKVEAFRLDHYESMIEKDGIRGMLDKMSDVCLEKAAEIRATREDESMAKKWERDAKTLDSMKNKLVTR